ncbi:hypothetical protein, partial [Pseudomonas aeruginosa]|uniref:hypothetical protein n=1 Tax=Pseudomonas aeruginosa TaxID=287 RepID=UPI003009BBB3
SIFVDRESDNEVNIRMMTLLQDAPGWCFRERLLDEAKRMTQDALKDTSRTENESRSGCSAGLDDQGRFRKKLSHRAMCAGCKRSG